MYRRIKDQGDHHIFFDRTEKKTNVVGDVELRFPATFIEFSSAVSEKSKL